MQEIKVGIIGFGEVGKVFTKGLTQKTEEVYIYDILLEGEDKQIINDIEKLGAKPLASLENLGRGCDVIFSLVTSSASEKVAETVSTYLAPETLFVDFTTSTPEIKLRSEKKIVESGGIFVDGAIMGTVATEQYQVRLLIAGEKVKLADNYFTKLGLNYQSMHKPVGTASSIKLLRSIFMKGLEALIIETMVTSKKYNVEKDVMKSISDTLNNNDFNDFSKALIKTHIDHRVRRYKEVSDCYKLINYSGLPAHVTKGVLSFFSESSKLELDNTFNNTEEILDFLLLKNVSYSQ